MENDGQIFTRVDNPGLRRPRKLLHMDTEETNDDSDDDDNKIVKAAKPPHRKAKKQHHHHHHHHLRRRSSLNAEIEGSFDSGRAAGNNGKEGGGNVGAVDSSSVLFHRNHHDISTLEPGTHSNMQSSMSMLSVSTNNAITVAPSRNSRLELNVFDTRHHKRHRRRRSTTPDPISHHGRMHRSVQSREDGLQSLLERLDNRIKNNFGDWTSADDDANFEYRNVGWAPGGQAGRAQQRGPAGSNNGPVVHSTAAVSLPPLYKNYQAVLKSAKGKLMDKTCVAKSKDNNDAKSILSEAKRTLTQMGIDRAAPK